jgi:maltooligosyltrehalose trehalohydrolase
VLLLTSPFTPMLWMGEEWATSSRWPFFTSHPEAELAEATGRGRVEEFAEHGWDVEQMIDPQDPAAFTGAKLRWEEAAEPGHADMLSLYRELLRLRRELPDLANPRLDLVHVDFDEDARWVIVHRGALVVAANVGDQPQVLPIGGSRVWLATDPETTLEVDQLTLPGQSAAIIQR